jgi:hypothetical protein
MTPKELCVTIGWKWSNEFEVPWTELAIAWFRETLSECAWKEWVGHKNNGYSGLVSVPRRDSDPQHHGIHAEALQASPDRLVQSSVTIGPLVAEGAPDICSFIATGLGKGHSCCRSSSPHVY